MVRLGMDRIRLGSFNKSDTCRRGERDDPPAPRSAESFDTQGVLLVQRCLIVQRDEKGYGLTVSGDNPVFVQSVKPGGAAARAGVHQGDRIIKVNGTLVTQSNHQDVVKLIKSGSYVALTLLGPPPGDPCRPVSLAHTPSISQPHVPLGPKTSGTSERITGPQPVDPEQQQQCTNISYQTIKKMLEKEQTYLDKMLAEYNKNPSEKGRAEMQSAKKRIANLERQLHTIRGSHNDWQRTSPKSPTNQRNSGDGEGMGHRSSSFHVSSGQARVHPIMHQVSAPSFPREWMPPPSAPALVPANRNDTKPLGASASMENIANSTGHDGVSWSKQAGAKHSRQRSSPDNLMYVMEGMDYDMDALHPPLNIPPEHEDPRNNEGASPELVSKKARCTSRGSSFGQHDSCESPHGTPPESPAAGPTVDTSHDHGEDTDDANVSEEVPTSIELVDTGQAQQAPLLDASFGGEPCTNPMEGRPLPPLPTEAKVLPPPLPLTPATASHASQQYGTPPESQPLQTLPGSRIPIQQSNIISMDDDEGTSDNEHQSHVEDHGPFNSIWKLMRHPAHLSVFLHYLLTNTNEPSSLLFYIITDLYRLGSGKEMKKWAYEITSTFLVPHAPLAIGNIDETVLNEIDGVLQSSQEHEDDLKAVFVKARRKAKEQLTKLLIHFHNTRTIGLSNIFIPNDTALDEAIRDKNAEMKIIESLLVTELETLTKDELLDDQKSALASALATVLKSFGVKTPSSVALIEKFPTFVAKEKSRIKFFPRNKRFAFQTINTKGHHFQSQQYHCVTYCNHCQHIIWGVGDQGYQCSNCEMNIHKACVKVVEEQCIGSLRNKKVKKNHRMSSLGSGIMDIIPKTKKPQTSFSERHKRPAEEWSLDSGICVSSETVDSEKYVGRPERVHGEGSDHHSPHGSDGTERGPHSKKGNSIGRSESFRQRRETRPSYRKRSDPNIPRSKSDVDVEDKPNNLNHSGSSSNSSLSTRSLESPSNSCEMVHRTPSTAPADAGGHPPGGTPTSLGLHSGGTSVGQLDDSDLECDTEPPNWQNNVDRETLRLMKPKERKRQDVINELFHTERTHVRNLKILERLFFRPLQQEQLLSPELLNLLFPNLDELLDIHSNFNSRMKARRREEHVIGEIGEMMLQMMDGESGEYLKGAIATFCKNQSVALETLKNKQKKDQKLSQFLADAELHPVCRRLQLKDIIATGFQRLTKYPLLLENVAKYTAPNTVEHSRLLEAVDRSKDILAYVNQAVRDAENEHRLAELQRRMDRSAFDKVENPVSASFRNLDLRKHRLVHEGVLTWRLSRQKSLEVLMVLLEDLVVLLQRQDERLLLRFHSTTLPKALGEDARLTHSPILRLQHVITRDVATDKKAFFLVTTAEQQAIYEFAAASAAEKKMWLHHISAAMKPHGTAEQVIKRSEPERAGSTEDIVESALDNAPASRTPDMETPASREETPQGEADGLPGDLPQSKDVEPGERAEAYPVSEATTHPALVDFHEVVIRSSAPCETAQHVLTPVERLRRKDQEVLNAIKEKQDIVSEILRIPKGDYENIAEISEQASEDKGPMELLLQITYQANNLEKLINEALNVKEEDAVTASSGIGVIQEDGLGEPSSSSPKISRKASKLPAVPTDKLLSVTNPLVKYLTQLAPCIEEMERERQLLRKAVQQSRDQTQLLRVVKQQNGGSLSSGSQEQSRPCSFVSVTSSASDVEEQPQPATVDEMDATEAIVAASSCQETMASANPSTSTGPAELSESTPPPLPLSDVFREACVQTSQEQLCCCPITDLDEDTPTDKSESDPIPSAPIEEPVERPTEDCEVSETQQNPEIHEEVAEEEEEEEEDEDKTEDATTPTPESTPSAVYF